MRSGHMNKGVTGRLFRAGMSLVFLCVLMISFADAQTVSTSPLRQGYTTAGLDQMLAPIALYPDSLLIQVLMASTYPGEVAEAGRWLGDNPYLSGDAAIEAAKDFDWNISVKSLLLFPDVLLTMSSNMDWTVRLGNAFNAQREAVMDRIQYLRRKARAAGNLKSDERMNVIVTGNNIAIAPVSTEVIYVPYYNPTMIYGSWWWPGYAPYYWAPWRGYAYYPGYYPGGFMWGRGIWFSYTRFYGKIDWHRRHVHWNPPPGHFSSRRVKQGGRPRLKAPGIARPGSRMEGKPSYERPGYSRPDGNRSSRAATDRPAQGISGDYRSGRNEAAHGRLSGKRGGQHPGLVDFAHQPAYSRSLELHSADNSGHSRSVRPSSAAGQLSREMRPARSVQQTLTHPAESRPADVSRQIGTRSSSGASSHAGRHDNGGGRGGSRR